MTQSTQSTQETASQVLARLKAAKVTLASSGSWLPAHKLTQALLATWDAATKARKAEECAAAVRKMEAEASSLGVNLAKDATFQRISGNLAKLMADSRAGAISAALAKLSPIMGGLEKDDPLKKVYEGLQKAAGILPADAPKSGAVNPAQGS